MRRSSEHIPLIDHILGRLEVLLQHIQYLYRVILLLVREGQIVTVNMPALTSIKVCSIAA